MKKPGDRPRLKALRPRVQSLRPVGLASREARERKRDQARAEAQPWRAWYDLERWKKLRVRIFERDEWTCQQTGVALAGVDPAPDSPTCDHIRPHSGDPVLFWDPDNLQSVSKQYHDTIKRAREFADRRAAVRPDWLEPATCEVVIVCGPAGAGKSTWVKAHAAPGDRIIDLDGCATELSGHVGHDWDRARWLQSALWLRNQRLGELAKAKPTDRAWFIVGAPAAEEREWWWQKLRPLRVVVIAMPLSVCVARAGDRPVAEQASRWWSRYTPHHLDHLINT